MAETYGVLDYKGLPVETLAALVLGLRDSSRTKLALAGMDYSTETLLLASIRDSLAFLAWAETEDAQHGKNRPVSIVDRLLHPEQPEPDAVCFASAGDYERTRDIIMRGGILHGS